MKKKILMFFVLSVLFAISAYAQTNPFEGTWTGKPSMTIFFDTIEYSFKGNTWTLKKFKNGSVTETSEGTFSYTSEKIIMQQTRYKTTGDWKAMEMSTGGNYRIDGNKFFLDGVEFTKTSSGPQAKTTPQTNQIGGLYFTLTLPQGWQEVKEHKYLETLKEILGVNEAKGDYTLKSFTEIKNDNNFLLISEIPVPKGYTLEQITTGLPGGKSVINGKEYYIMTETFNSSSKAKVAYIIYKNVLHTFFFILNNSNISISDEVLKTISYK